MVIINKIAKVALVNFFTYIVFCKLINYKNNNYKKVIIMLTVSVIEAIIAVILSNYIIDFIGMLIIYCVHSYIIGKITNNKFQYSVIITFISLAIEYIIYAISIILASIAIKILLPMVTLQSPMFFLNICLIDSLLIMGFFKIKRLKNGIPFLQDTEKVSNVGILGFIFIGIALLIFSALNTSMGIVFQLSLGAGIIIEAIFATIWIRRKITKHYKQNLKTNTIEELENKLKAKDEEINKILEENKTIASINHKYSSRIKSLEKVSAKILTRPELVEAMKVEFGTEFGELEEQIKKISEEYSAEIKAKVKHENKLDKTGIFGIDNILEYMKEEAEKKDIKFDLKINANINYMIEKIIDQSRLETLLGDHIKDAIIAIDHSDNTYKSILTTIGIIDDCYEICIYDTGIEFEIETLLKLGTETVTTHKETGGSGIGFMTTFETLNETKASLIIEERHPMNDTDYTKSVAFRFDGKNEYTIKSYRKDKIEKQKTDNRIILK